MNGLKSVGNWNIGENVSIDFCYSFMNCLALEEVGDIVANTNFTYGCFYNCPNLKKIGKFYTKNSHIWAYYNGYGLTQEQINAYNLENPHNQIDIKYLLDNNYAKAAKSITGYQIAPCPYEVTFIGLFGNNNTKACDLHHYYRWGTGDEASKKSLIDSLITHSYNRRENNLDNISCVLYKD